MTDATIDVCPDPDCDSRNIYRRRPSIQGREHDHAYRCEACGLRFDDPRTRKRKRSVVDAEDHAADSARSSQLVSDLMDASPDEVGP
jgi:predicted RNA-binding Zn-ribbon protein involved in translation (DUF1610 family)